MLGHYFINRKVILNLWCPNMIAYNKRNYCLLIQRTVQVWSLGSLKLYFTPYYITE